MDDRIILANRRQLFPVSPQEVAVISIRRATVEDADLLRTMIRELAEFESELGSLFSLASIAPGKGHNCSWRTFLSALNSAAKGLERPCSVMSRTSRKTRT